VPLQRAGESEPSDTFAYVCLPPILADAGSADANTVKGCVMIVYLISKFVNLKLGNLAAYYKLEGLVY